VYEIPSGKRRAERKVDHGQEKATLSYAGRNRDARKGKLRLGSKDRGNKIRWWNKKSVHENHSFQDYSDLSIVYFFKEIHLSCVALYRRP